MSNLILLSVFVVSTCGIVYELLAGTLASYLLGDSVLQFSTVIGSFMSALGVGSWLSKYIIRGLSSRFVQLQTAIGLLGGLSGAILFLVFGFCSPGAFRFILYFIVFAIGTLCGLELPLMLRILKDKLEFKDLVSQVMALDYVGSLLASILFPIFLVPHLGLVRTSCMFGIINVLVALAFVHLLEVPREQRFWYKVQAWGVILVLGSTFFLANTITSISEDSLYTDNIILTRVSPYQRLVVTRKNDDIRLYLSNNLQFSSKDEYRYHEALVHPAMQSVTAPKQVLILGGGDGLAAREILTYPSVEKITLVDLDPLMTELFSTNSMLRTINKDSLNSSKVEIVNDDAFIWLKNHPQTFDVIIVDFPDPSNFSVGKLYTTTFYKRLRTHLKEHGVATVQCTSPMFSRRSFWCIVKTIAESNLYTLPFHTYVPSFGEWGFCLVSKHKLEVPNCTGTRYLTPGVTQAMFDFPIDLSKLPCEINELHNQILVRYYDIEWQEMLQ